MPFSSHAPSASKNRIAKQLKIISHLSSSGWAPVAKTDHRTTGKSRTSPHTAQCLSRISASDGSIVGRAQQVSFDRLVGAPEKRRRHCKTLRLGGREPCDRLGGLQPGDWRSQRARSVALAAFT